MDLGDALHHEMHLARARVAAYVVLAPPLIAHTPVKLHFFQIVLVSCRGVVVVRMVIVRVIVRQPAVVVAVEPPQELRPLAKCGSRGAVDPVLVAHDHSEALPSVGKFETCSVGRKRLRQHEVGVRRLDKRGGVEVDWRTARVSVTVQRVDVDIYRNFIIFLPVEFSVGVVAFIESKVFMAMRRVVHRVLPPVILVRIRPLQLH
mmetsp:Transcript_1855/g.4101  ORF Transcript_1855/g.4101 Transcript_1855/m.4101 type:complete len:204 (-) Transcript_1855:270-881(-)